MASAAFIPNSETPPKGDRDAACIWNNEALTKSLDLVPNALFSRSHQISLSYHRRLNWQERAQRPDLFSTRAPPYRFRER
jgi:hypothetical protein